MGDAPQQPAYKAPAGQQPFIPTGGIDLQQLQNATSMVNPGQGSTNPAQQWNVSGLQGLPNAQGISSPEGQSVAADLLSYQMSDADLAQRYPWLMQARDAYGGFTNNVLSQQTPQSVYAGQSLTNAGKAMIPAAQQNISQGQSIIGQAQPFLSQATNFANQASTVGQPDMTLGQNMVNGQAMDPLVQQELMRSGLSSAAGALGGAAALGGTAGQAAVGRNLGVGAQNWINQQRTMGMQLQQTGAGLSNTYANNASGLAGAGTGIIGAGTNVENTGTGILNSATGAMTGGQGIINSADQNANATFGEASSLFQPRTFGLSGADAANIALSNTTGQNNMNQYTYAQQVQGAQFNSGISGANASAQSQASGNMISGGATVGASAAAIGVAFALSCWCAFACFGPGSKFLRFRFWMMNQAPKRIRSLYILHGKPLALWLLDHPVQRGIVKLLMEAIISGVPQHVPA